jgi:hypothetical protein
MLVNVEDDGRCWKIGDGAGDSGIWRKMLLRVEEADAGKR